MYVEIGTEAAQFPEKEYINGIFLAVCQRSLLKCQSVCQSSLLRAWVPAKALFA
jgi:hypothetical protein